MDINYIREICQQKDYEFKSFGEDPRLLIIGEEHSNKSHLSTQLELIKVICPSVILHEFYDPTIDDKLPTTINWEENASLYKISQMQKISQELETRLLPGDIPTHERRILCRRLDSLLLGLDWSAEISEKDWLTEELDYAFYYSRLIVEPLMGMILQTTLKENLGNIVSIYGAYHLREDSQLHSVLRLNFPPLAPNAFLKSHSLSPQSYITINQDSKK